MVAGDRNQCTAVDAKGHTLLLLVVTDCLIAPSLLLKKLDTTKGLSITNAEPPVFTLLGPDCVIDCDKTKPSCLHGS